MKIKKRRDPIPGNVTREELAKFWDTHDITDYLDELKPIKVTFAKNLSEGITVRLDSKTLEQLRKISHTKGIGPTTLARMCIMEHLQHETSSVLHDAKK